MRDGGRDAMHRVSTWGDGRTIVAECTDQRYLTRQGLYRNSHPNIMADLFRNRYRIPSARRPNWDYAWSANYFITICTKGRVCYFGDVVNGEMRLSECGQIVKEEWGRTTNLRSDMNLFTDVFVVMPNHFHAIVSIGDNRYNNNDALDGGRDATHGRDAIHGRDAMHRVSKGNAQDDYANVFGPQSKNLSSIVRGFKSAVTGRARQIHADFGWQSRFHDHIIRTGEDYGKIHRYILNNPLSWKEDRFYPDNLSDL
jgi:putative transposase